MKVDSAPVRFLANQMLPFPGFHNRQINSNRIQKTHELDDSLLNDPNYYFITTIRNPMDAMVSFMMVNKTPFTKDNIDTSILLFQQYYKLINIVRKSKYSLLLK